MAHVEVIPSYNEALASSTPMGNEVERPRVMPALSEHVYRNKELSVILNSYAVSPTATPVFYPNSAIEGAITLTLPKGRSPNELRITVIVAGKLRDEQMHSIQEL